MMYGGFDEGVAKIRKICDELNLNKKVLKRALSLFEVCSNTGFVRGRGLNSVVGACIYTACRENQPGVIMHEISTSVNEDTRTLGRSFRAMSRMVDIRPLPHDYDGMLKRAISRLELPTGMAKTAGKVLNDYIESGDSVGKNPCSLAGAALYYIAKKNSCVLTQKDVSEQFGVSDMSIRMHLGSIRNHVKL